MRFIVPDLQSALVLDNNMNALNTTLFSILLVVVLLKANGRRNFRTYMDYCNCTSNSLFAEPCDCHIDKTFDPPKAFFDLQLHKEVNKANFSFEVFALRNDNSTYVLFNSTGNDYCALFTTKAKSQLNLITIFRGALQKAGNLPEKCPIDKDFHISLKEVAIDPEQFPPYVPEARVHARFNVTTPNGFLVLINIYGEVIQKSKRRWG